MEGESNRQTGSLQELNRRQCNVCSQEIHSLMGSTGRFSAKVRNSSIHEWRLDKN